MECFFSESRALFISATGLNRKSGKAQWRDLLFLPRPSELWMSSSAAWIAA
jgi:hypothetical protein